LRLTGAVPPTNLAMAPVPQATFGLDHVFHTWVYWKQLHVCLDAS